MKTIIEWIEGEMREYKNAYTSSTGDRKVYVNGIYRGLGNVLAELKAREAAAKDQGPEILELADRAKTLHEGVWSILMALKEKCLKLAEGPPQKATWWGGRPHINKLNAEPAKKEILALADEGHERLTKADTVAHDLVLQALRWRGHLMTLLAGRMSHDERFALMKELKIEPRPVLRLKSERIRDLRRDLSVAGDAEERSKISQELLDAEDEHQEDVGEDMARDRHARAMRRREPKGGCPRETWGDDDA